MTPHPPPLHSDPPNLAYSAIMVMASPSFDPSSPPLPTPHPPFTLCVSSHIHLPLLCVCPFCDVISEDTDAPSWTNSGVSLLLLSLLPFLTQLFFFNFYSLCMPSSLAPLTHPPSSQLYFFSCFTCLNSLALFALIVLWTMLHFLLFLLLLLTDCVGLRFIEAWSWSCQCHFFVAGLDERHCDFLLQKNVNVWQQKLLSLWTHIFSISLLDCGLFKYFLIG